MRASAWRCARCWRRWATTMVEADSGRAALDAVQEQSFAVILMDVVMPILDGYETARLIRQRTKSESTPIIFLTAFRRDETETAAAYANGAVDFIFTPVLAEVLRAKVSAFVHVFLQSRGAAALAGVDHRPERRDARPARRRRRAPRRRHRPAHRAASAISRSRSPSAWGCPRSRWG